MAVIIEEDDERNPIARGYEALAAPVRAWFQPAANNLIRAPGEIWAGKRPTITGLSAPPEYQTPPESTAGKIAAEAINPIPPTLAGAITQAATLMAPATIPARIAYGTAGNLMGNIAAGEAPGKVATDAALTGAATGAVEGATAGVGALIRALPYVKGRINESQSQALRGVMGEINPASTAAIDAQPVSPWLKGGQTMAQIRSAATGGDLQAAASARIDAAVNQVDAMSGHPQIQSAAIDRAYAMVPDLVREEVIGPLALIGQTPAYTLQQAQAIRGYLGTQAFAQSPVSQGVTPAAMQLLRGRVTTDIEGAIAPHALPLWAQANREYGGLIVMNEWLNQPNAKQGLPNRMFFNRNSLSDYLDQNQQDAVRRLGQPAYDLVVERALGGAQPGTRDILTPGAGTPTSALRQVYGRGQGGAPQIIGSAARVGLSNLGSEYTGRAPYSMPPQVQAGLDILAQRLMDQARERGIGNLQSPVTLQSPWK